MTVSVLIPAYNCEKTIKATLESALNQTLQQIEILVMDDGSTDGTGRILESYKPRIAVFRQANGGLSSALNAMCERADGDLIARLDSDDIWHPSYLEVQQELFEANPKCAALFTGHLDFPDGGSYEWRTAPDCAERSIQVLSSTSFLQEYNTARRRFASMSYCCVPKRIFKMLDREPFKTLGAEDVYFLNRAALFGDVLYDPTPLVAYRVRDGSLASNRLRCAGAEVEAFELLQRHYRGIGDERLQASFDEAMSSRRRVYAKLLLGAGRTSEAQRQLRTSLIHSTHSTATVKSLVLLGLSFLPRPLQPAWPSIARQWTPAPRS
jgi:glycosyltransferase involved in cell wall biosynthesis